MAQEKNITPRRILFRHAKATELKNSEGFDAEKSLKLWVMLLSDHNKATVERAKEAQVDLTTLPMLKQALSPVGAIDC